MNPKYRDLYFGKSDSQNEANEHPDEFVRSYVDLNGVSSSALRGDKFLILGPKGTGKTALARYLQATESNGTHLALVRDASSLPLSEIPRLQTGQPSGPERTVVAWKFVLLCNYLELLLRDQGCSIQQNAEAVRVSKLLRDFGFMGDASGRALLRASTTTITIPLPKLGQMYKRESRPEINIYNLIPYLEAWAAEAESEISHVLLLDGLDSIFLNDLKYDESLSSLVQAAYGINQRLRESRATGSIVLLLRNDVFSRISLSLPDSQKMRDDLSLDLDWRVLSGRAGSSAPLIKLVNAKAAQALGSDPIQVLEYFPNDIQLGKRGTAPRWIPRLQYLLNLTRHTPRDLLRLFEEIRKVDASDMYPYNGKRLSGDVIREGVLQYSTKYFVGAIRNEFAGVEGGAESATSAISALQGLGKQHFNRAEFARALNKIEGSVRHNPDRLLKFLFYAGAIGNYIARRDETYLQFYHRRDETEIYLGGGFILHNALVHAWSMPHGV
jgi:hypothetical protein